jgi:hypothetical protein
MTVDPANARELGEIAHEVGADILEGALTYPSETGGWPLGYMATHGRFHCLCVDGWG